MYIKNNCSLGFYVRRNSWDFDRFAKIVAIQWVENVKMITGKPPYFGNVKYPACHLKEGKIIGQKLVTLKADWLTKGIMETVCGGNYSWEQVYPKEINT